MVKDKDSVVAQLQELQQDVSKFFDKCTKALGKRAKQNWYKSEIDYYWAPIPEKLKLEADILITRFMSISKKIAYTCRRSVLIDEADVRELSTYVKRIRATIRLRKFYYHEADLIHDEGTVLGFKPATQSEDFPIKPKEANSIYVETVKNIYRIYQLSDQDESSNYAEKGGKLHVSKYRPNSAFIMMWMDPTKPELEDIRDAIVETFNKFDIKAVRADEIEHEGMITQRIIDEIKTSEFLFADLTGARPNVYYEVGFAHALGKRVILFRKRGTGLHFDLAGYNCPEYENLRDLKEKFIKRLENLTNKKMV